MKIIFLDIDGVLNSNKWFNSDEYRQESGTASDAMIMLVNHQWHLDPKAIQLINRLVDTTGAEVVISSTWKIKYDVDQLNEMLTERGATFKAVGRTPHVQGRMSEHVPRGREIQAYLNSLSEQPETFVILDDRDDMNQLFKYLIKTGYEDGFTTMHLARAIKMLNGDK
jgi:histidinol phosphatase-like enzyme